ncbi:ribonuclease H-like domain-containing protein, partial [Tanacetum coccineum]
APRNQDSRNKEPTRRTVPVEATTSNALVSHSNSSTNFEGNPQQDLKDKGVIDSNFKGGKITGKDFKLTDESHVLLKVPRKDNMYSVDLKNLVPQRGLTYLFAKATSDESNLWPRRLGHVNFKTMNKRVKGNLVRDTVMSDSNESGVTHMEISSPFEDLSDIGSPGVVGPEHEGLPWMLDDPYVQVVLQASPSPDYKPGPEEP